MVHIRVATSLDSEAVREVHLHAFPEGEKQKVATLAANLLSEETNPKTISLVAEVDGAIVSHVAFSPVTIDDERWLVKLSCVAPLKDPELW
ncbi:MAG: hypothetical protein AAFY72_09045 [Cyanobacteria bacterium J06649_4]